MKLQQVKKYFIYSTDVPWMVSISFTYNEELKDYIKELPGRKWDKDNKRWIVPFDCLEILDAEFRKHGYIPNGEIK